MRTIYLGGLSARQARGLVTGGLAVLAACGPSASGSSPMEGGASTFPYQPSNISLADVSQFSPMAQDENVSGACDIRTDATAPEQDCFSSPIEAVTQEDGSTVNLIVVKSLAIQSTGMVGITGGVPLVVISLATVDLLGASIVASSAGLSVGPGGAAPAAANMNGTGLGGGTGGSGSATVGGSGGSYCGIGGLGGGQTMPGTAYGSADIRPLVGGSAGGGGAVGSGAGGGAIQISAATTLTMNAGSTITVGGQAGTIGGLAADQNAGGGGSGGSILLESPHMSLEGFLAANGGGGGGDYTGMAAEDATPSAVPAAGGTGGTSGNAGGAGGSAAVINGSPGQSSATSNSGGGGGGTGRIRVNGMGVSLGSSSSPADTTSCALVGDLRAAAQGP